MDTFECYLAYRAVKAHFNTASYDYFKNEGRIKAKKMHLLGRSDKAFFEYLSCKLKHTEVIEFFVANIVHHPDFYIGELMEPKAMKVYNKWQGRIESIHYLMQQTIVKIKQATEENDLKKALKKAISVDDGDYPILYKLMMWQDIPIECFVLLESFIGFFSSWEVEIEEKLIWPKVRDRCVKYRPFLIKFLGKEKIRSLAHSIVAEETDKYLHDGRRDCARNCEREL